MFGSELDAVYMETPEGTRLVELYDLKKPWNGEAIAGSWGTYRIYGDNTRGGEKRVLHGLITYHESAPGAVQPR